MSEQGSEGGEERSHDPTQKRLDEARKRGDVARSMEVNTWFILAGTTLALMITANFSATHLNHALVPFLAYAHLVPDDPAALFKIGKEALFAGFIALSLPIGIVLLAAFAGSFVQNRPLWTTDPLAPKASRISIMGGMKRLFGKEAWMNFIKGLLKIILVGCLVSLILWGDRKHLLSIAQMDVAAYLPILQTLSLQLFGAAVALFGVLAGIDFFYQRFEWIKKQRMTHKELKEEFKETEGNPEIKAKLRQIRNARARKRMMAQVPQATVIITNPTHYSIALKYETGMAAPICLAKGVDTVALRIREVAEKHEIPLVENPPLARALYKSAELDEEIPVDHYKAVAEVIGYLARLRRRR